MPATDAWFGIDRTGAVGVTTGNPPTSFCGTNAWNVSTTSPPAVVPVTVAQRRVSVPPGIDPDGVEMLDTAPPQPVTTALPATYCSVPGRASVRSTLVTVCPLATFSVRVNVRG